MALGLQLGGGPAGATDVLHELVKQRLFARDLEQQQARDLARTDLQKQGLALDRQALLDRNAATVADEAHRTRLYGLTEREIAQAAEAAQADAERDAAAAEREQQRIDLERQRVDISKLTEGRLADAATRSAAEAAAAREQDRLEQNRQLQDAARQRQAEFRQRQYLQGVLQSGVDPTTGQPLSPGVRADLQRQLLGIENINRSETSFPGSDAVLGGLGVGLSAPTQTPSTEDAEAIAALQEAGLPPTPANVAKAKRDLGLQ